MVHGFGQLVSKIPHCDIPFRLPFAHPSHLQRESGTGIRQRYEMEMKMEQEVPSGKKRTTFSDVPLFPEIFHSNDPKSHVPFNFQSKFPKTFCK